MRTAFGARWALFLFQAGLPRKDAGRVADADRPATLPDTKTLPWRERRLRGELAPAWSYPWRGRIAWECAQHECGECGVEDTPAAAGDAARCHLADAHGFLS